MREIKSWGVFFFPLASTVTLPVGVESPLVVFAEVFPIEWRDAHPHMDRSLWWLFARVTPI
jgi:hypothetical protein